MRCRSVVFFLCLIIQLTFTNATLRAESCFHTWISPNPNHIYAGSGMWQQSLPMPCQSVCARITVTLEVLNYNDVGALDLYFSNTNSFDYGDPTVIRKKMGWAGRVNVPPSFVNPGWKTVTFSFRLPHLEWLNDDGTIHIALLGHEYFVYGVRAQFRVAASTITTIACHGDMDGDGNIDGSDLAELAADYGCTGECNADFDSNGVVDEHDILIFMDEYGWSRCPLGFYESFNDGFANNWVRTAGWSVVDGVYQMNGAQPPQALWQSTRYDQTFYDFSFDTSLKQVQGAQGNAFGIFFRSNLGRSTRYEFLIAAAGAYSINKYVSGAFTQLVEWTPTIHLRTGYNVWNRLGVSCIGSTLQFFINDVLVQTVSDAGISSGYAGLCAVDSNEVVNVFHFDNALLEQQ